MAIEWRSHIHSDPGIFIGKPLVRGTRLTVDFILKLYATGWSEAQVLDNYPSLTSESLRAVFAFAADVLSEESVFAAPSTP